MHKERGTQMRSLTESTHNQPHKSIIGAKGRRRSWFLALVMMLSVLAILPALPADAAPGDLDTTFDGDGLVITNLGGSADSAFQAALRPTGEILVGGNASSAVDLGVVQYMPDGSIDTSFGVAGVALANFGANDQATVTLLQPDGKVVLAGHTTFPSGTRDWALARFDAAGVLDTSFDGDGMVTTNFSGEDNAQGGVLQPDGKIVIVGFSSPSGRRWSLARYNANGSLDSTFGTGGKVTTTVGGSDQIARAVALQSDGKIVAAGFDGSNVVVARYATDGTLDTAFGGTGIVVTDVPGSGRDLGFAVEVLSSGKILVAGVANGAFAILRYDANGMLDTTFDTDGFAVTDFGPGEDTANGVAVLPNGQYLTVGDKRGAPRSFGLVLYNTDGSLDTGFGTGGLLTTGFGGGIAVARDVVIQTDGKAVVVGVTTAIGASASDFAIARYNLDLPTTGSIHEFKFEDAEGGGDPQLGFLDAVVVNESNQMNRACIGDGAGGFTCNDVSGDMEKGTGVAVGDVDADGNLDAAISNSTFHLSEVCFGDGTGGFSSCTDISGDASTDREIAVGHVDSDVHLDVVLAGQNDENRVCLGDGAGGFNCADISTSTDLSTDVKLGFIDGDSNLDAVIANEGQTNEVCLGDGAGNLACSAVSADTNFSFGVDLGYVDAGGTLDAVFANGNQKNSVCLGDGTGGFSCSDVSTDNRNSQDVALGDLDGDSDADAVFANHNSTNRVCLGDGTGGFVCQDASPDSVLTISVGLGDFDGDTILDAFFANTSNQVNHICIGNGAGAFTCSNVSTGLDSTRVAVGNLGGPTAAKPPMAGVEFTLTGGSLAVPLVTVTNGAGEFSFDDLDPGTYTVTETVPFGYISTTGASTVVTIDAGEQVVAFTAQTTLDPGEFETVNPDLNFGNKPNSDPTVGADTDPVEVDEGDTANNTGTVSDPDGDTVSLTASVGVVVNNGNGTWSWSFDTDDGPTESQTVTINGDDNNGGIDDAEFDLTVNNVAPTATFGNDGPVNEGTSFNLDLTAPIDPSSADTLAGFTYAFDCGSGYGPFSASTAASCTTTDNEVRNVKAKIRDKDLDETEYTDTVTIDNALPVVSVDEITDELGSQVGLSPEVGLVALEVDLAGSFTDEGPLDTHMANIDWDDATMDVLGPVTVAGGVAAVHTYLFIGDFTVTLTVTDDDLGVGSDTYDLTIVDLGGAIALMEVDLTLLAGNPAVDPAAVTEINKALSDLDTASTKWAEENPRATANNVRKAIEKLEAAEAADPTLDLSSTKLFLARATKSAAVFTIQYAESVGADPVLVQDARDLVAEGDTFLAANDFVNAALKYRDAIGLVDGFLDDPPPNIYADGEATVTADLTTIAGLALNPSVAPAAALQLTAAADNLTLALAKIASDDPGGAINKIKAAISKLEKAEAKDASLDLTALKDSLTGAARSLAADAVILATDNAVTPGDFDDIAGANTLIAAGDILRSIFDYTGAAAVYKSATQVLGGLI